MYQLIKDLPYVKHLPSGMTFPYPAVETYGFTYQDWLDAGNIPLPPDQPDLETTRSKIWNSIKIEKSIRKNGGVFVSGKWFHTDTDSVQQFINLRLKARDLLSSGSNLIDPIIIDNEEQQWKTLDNTAILLTIQIVLDVVEAIEVLNARIHKHGELLKSMVYNSNDPESIDITTGWPDIYKPI